ncbi:hypothetical protein CALVIDRAFT_378946 [Calocera viscosa TUFC12733]|uniref:F-box domain-containing protein n=1 Tax=Calocera viscosa (strain TUFC12733) TaxID=1330018 RepID=A0A167Q357_CALVF|nr:hypothetical protein CALVIDRAFT_378946 [Calocera viscosa TUFC12733]
MSSSLVSLDGSAERTALPTELWDLIFSSVPARADLASLSAVSNAFYELATRHLYRDLSLRRGIPTVQQCLVLARKPQLARHVRSMTVIFGLDGVDRAGASRTRSYARSPTEMFAPAYARLFFRVYNASARLAALSLSSFLAFEECLTANLFRFPPLVDYFEVGARGPPGDILNALPNVERLFMIKVFGCNIDNLSSSALPKLRSVRCSLRQAETLIPGRPVQEVALEATTLDLDHLPRVIDTLSLSTAPIQALDIKLRTFNLDTFGRISTAFPTLQEFVLTVLDVPQTGLFDLSPDELVTRGGFSRFVQLQTLEIHAFYGPLPATGWTVPLRPIIAQIGHASRSLKSVTIVDRGTTHAHEAAVPSYRAVRLGKEWEAEMTYRNCRNRRSPLFAGYCGDFLYAMEVKPEEKYGRPQCFVM